MSSSGRRRERLPAFIRQADQLTAAARQQAAAGHVRVLAVCWAAVWNRCALDVVACEGKGQRGGGHQLGQQQQRRRRETAVGQTGAGDPAGSSARLLSDCNSAAPQAPASHPGARPRRAAPPPGRGRAAGPPGAAALRLARWQEACVRGRAGRQLLGSELLLKLRCDWETGTWAARRAQLQQNRGDEGKGGEEMQQNCCGGAPPHAQQMQRYWTSLHVPPSSPPPPAGA